MNDEDLLTNTYYRMIDIGKKRPTQRRAIAQGRIHVGEHAFVQIKEKTLPKGDACAMAEIVGIQGAKRVHELLPLCHPLNLEQVSIHTELEEGRHAVLVTCLVSAFARTGVEMEALAGVNAALLAIYDLTKMVEPALSISDVRLLVKEGGKSGRWLHPKGVPQFLRALEEDVQPSLEGISAAVLTVSDRAAAGKYEDQSGLLIQEILSKQGASVIDYQIVPDDAQMIEKHITALVLSSPPPNLLITTGGTGLGLRDVTPDTLAALCTRFVPGLSELLRQEGARYTKNAWLSRCVAGVINATLVIALPGSPRAVREGMDTLKDVLPHALEMMRGGGHD